MISMQGYSGELKEDGIRIGAAGQMADEATG
jgi:hypothetical protein